jgi:hypothetical protein
LLLLGCSQVVQKHKRAARAVKRFDSAKLLLPRWLFQGSLTVFAPPGLAWKFHKYSYPQSC